MSNTTQVKVEAPVTDTVVKATRWAIPCLVLGAGLGLLFSGNKAVIEPLHMIGTLWTNYLRLCAIPLVLLLLLSAIVKLPSRSEAKRVGTSFAITMIGILLFGAVIAVIADSINWNTFNPGLFPAMEGTNQVAERESFVSWIKGLIPSNFVEAASKGDVLPLLIAVSIFAFALRCVSQVARTRILDFFEGILEVVMTMTRWGILLLPVGVLALSFVFAADFGLSFLKIALHFLALSIVAFVSASLLLIIICSVICGKSPYLVIRSVIPSIVAAASTRSSLACLPCMVSDVKTGSLASESSASFSLPLAVAVLKANRTVSSTLKLLFVAGISSVSLSFPEIGLFVLSMMLLSVSTPGIPRTGSTSSLGIYLSLGLPASTIILLEVVEPILDIFKTVYNVIADIGIAMVVGRFEKS